MPMPSPPATPSMSQDSTVFGIDSTLSLESPVKRLRQRALQHAKDATVARDVFIFLVAFRIVNALSIKTFFQPDEYFQSLEPAWEIAFGANSGAWITWEWKHHLRTSLHPVIFAAIYKLAAGLSWILHLSPTLRAHVLIAAPKVAQAICAAVGDFYTWKLGEKVFGHDSNESWCSLFLTIFNPWQWFCSTRTLSNCLESTLTVAALNSWPWSWSVINDVDDEPAEAQLDTEPKEDDYVHVEKGSPRVSENAAHEQSADGDDDTSATAKENVSSPPQSQRSLRTCLFLAAVACVLRPTNLLLWILFAFFACLRSTTYGFFMETRWIDSPIWVNFTALEFLPNAEQRWTLIRESIICGSVVMLFSSLTDLLYFRQLTFPPLRFLYFNIAQSLAIFYGNNRGDYYLTEGVPLLLTTYLPFGVVGICHALGPPRFQPTFINNSAWTKTIKYQMATTCLIVPLVLSLISHKEVRFILPLLPLLHILAASSFTTYFLPSISPAVPRRTLHTFKRLLLVIILMVNIAIGILATTSHQTAPISVMSYLRQQHSLHYLSQPPPHTLSPAPSTMTVGFLMPCHSTPWRSRLVFPSIKAWALGCEPPVNFNQTQRAAYLDEADQFYADPRGFLSRTLGKPPAPRKKPPLEWPWPLRLWTNDPRKVKRGFGREEMIEADAWDGRPGRKTWPEYLVFFEEKEQLLKQVARRSAYRECWRGWNSWGHDDWRRKGDVIVWCLRSQKGRKWSLAKFW